MPDQLRPISQPPRVAAGLATVHVDPVHELLSGEAVAIDVQPVGVVFRALGAMIDVLVSIAVVLLFAWLIDWATAFGLLNDATSSIFTIVMIVFSFVVLPCTIEIAMKGRSLGKLAIGGRIVRVDGGAATTRHAIIRSLTGVLETYMTLGGIAIVAGAFSPRSQRLGDLLAGTYCQRVRTKPLRVAPLVVPEQLQSWAEIADVALLPDRLGRRINQYFAHAPSMEPEARFHVANGLLAETEPFVSPLPNAHPEVALRAILAVRRLREAQALHISDARVRQLSGLVRQ